MDITSARLTSPSTRTTAVIVASDLEGDCSSLRGIFTHSVWKFYQTRTCRETLALVRKHYVPVVISEPVLPDGDWKALLLGLADLPVRPRLIVCSEMVEPRLWAEALNLGAYDVLVKPFDRREVLRVGFLAWQSLRDEQERLVAVPKPPSWVGHPGTRKTSATAA